jgi:glycosyltransferase involved in cell wall biosynthesis
MLNIAIINTGSKGSTGKIARNLYHDLKQKGYNVTFCFGHGVDEWNPDFYVIDNKYDRYWHSLMSRLFGKQGTHSSMATRRLIKVLKSKNIDTVIALSLHGNYLNQTLFFKYLKKSDIQLLYLMIDEYPYVGKCTGTEGCTKYQHGCGHCKALMLHTPSWFFDRSAELYKWKQRNYDSVKRIAFAGPEFVINTAKLSPMMKGHNMFVLDEAINTETYSPKDAQALKKELGIDDDKIVVVTATSYSPDYKGSRYFDEAARLLENDERFLFVHIANDRQGIERPQSNLIIRGYIETLEEMAVYFSMADIFLFPSLQDTMSNTCLEALACGTPLLCFNISGMPYLGDPSVLTLVEPRDSMALVEALKSTNKKTKKEIEHCRNYALLRYDSRKYCDKILSILENY